MKKRIFAVIHSRAINYVTGLRKLADEDKLVDGIDFDLEIEITINPGPTYVPADEDIRKMFPEIQASSISRLRVQFRKEKACYAVRMTDGRIIYLDVDEEKEAVTKARNIALAGDGEASVWKVTKVKTS